MKVKALLHSTCRIHVEKWIFSEMMHGTKYNLPGGYMRLVVCGNNALIFYNYKWSENK